MLWLFPGSCQIVLSFGLILLIYSWSMFDHSRRCSCNFSCLVMWCLGFIWLRSSFSSDGIRGALILSLLGCTYLWRGDSNPVSFFASEALIYFLLAAIAIFSLVSSWDMLIIYLSIELQSLCFYTLCVINRSANANGATEAAIKYLLMSALASSLLLFGTSIRYGETGSTNLAQWLELQMSGMPILSGSLWVVLVAALLIKVAASPFHMWAPDLYESAPLVVTAFIATSYIKSNCRVYT